MKEPTHNIKLYSGNNVPCPDSTWYESAPHWYQNNAHGWLGSGVKDVNGNEIFEGDIVRHEIWEKDIPVTFHDGAFWLGDTDCPLCYQFGKLLEIVGHVIERGTP